MHNKKETLVISLGGSLICPDGIDTKFLKIIVSIIKKEQKNKRIVIITGGGHICREYLTAFDKVRNKTNSTPGKDYVAIGITVANAKLMQSLLADADVKLHPALLNNPTKKINWGKYKVVVGCGYKPGHSTDYDAVLAAIVAKSRTVVNLTNIDYVYTKDPNKFRNAKPLKELTWREYKKVLGVVKWKAGLHTPFDPIASRLAEKNKIAVYSVNGQKKKSLASAFTDKPIGTHIFSTKR